MFSNLSREAQDRLFPSLELVPLEQGECLSAAGDVLQDAYFPVNCIISLINVTSEGQPSEISVVGKDGIVGLSLVLAGGYTMTDVVVQSTGSAYRLDNQELKKEFNRHEELYKLLLRYTQIQLTQFSQNGTCLLYHSIYQRLSRWLLMCYDRLPGDEINMTQDFLSMMLGVRRSGVSVAASHLQENRIIEYKRGSIKLLDREKLEENSCECYGVVKKEIEKLTLT